MKICASLAILPYQCLICLTKVQLLPPPLYRRVKLLGVRCITSFIDHVIQIYVGQKGKANQWKVTVLEEFLHAVLLYQ